MNVIKPVEQDEPRFKDSSPEKPPLIVTIPSITGWPKSTSFGIPLLFALSYPHVFLKALGMAGGFGSALLLGVLPIIMVWRAKYDLKENLANGTFLSNRFVLSFLLLFMIFEIWTQIQATF